MAVNFVVMVRISLVSLLINQLSLPLSIKVERNHRDTFQNPDCLTTDADCSSRPCSRYSAYCLTSACKFCECYDDDATFTFQEGDIIGRCMSTDQFAQFPGPKERMNIRVKFQEDMKLTQCLYVSYLNLDDKPLVIHHGCYTEDEEYYWIYTKKQQLMSLNRFDCLTVGDDNVVTVSPCRTNFRNQQWFCDVTGTVYSIVGGSPKYANGSFSLSTTELQEWRRYDPGQGSEGKDNGNVCDMPVEYKGCYKLGVEKNGSYSFMKNVKADSSYDSFIINVLAPIHMENTKCAINWQDSTYLKNDKPWKSIGKIDSGITVSNADGYSKGIDLKVSSSSRKKWNGTVLKLEVRCSTRTTHEQHCVLIKFHSGSHNDEDDGGSHNDEDDGDNDNDEDDGDNDNQDEDGIFITYEKNKCDSKLKPYKISTIVLAICLGMVLTGISIYFVLQKKRCKRRQASSDIQLQQLNA